MARFIRIGNDYINIDNVFMFKVVSSETDKSKRKRFVNWFNSNGDHITSHTFHYTKISELEHHIRMAIESPATVYTIPETDGKESDEQVG